MTNVTPYTSNWTMCETPKSPPGDYNDVFPVTDALDAFPKCETPKSPPGDYNLTVEFGQYYRLVLSVKHLNPRQGITTCGSAAARAGTSRWCVKHLNPRQGITTCGTLRGWAFRQRCKCETPKSPPGDYNSSQTPPISSPSNTTV